MFGLLKRFEHTKAYDVAAAAPLVAFYGWGLSRDLPMLAQYLAELKNDGFGPVALVGALVMGLSLAFAGLIIVMVFIRTLPIKKSSGIAPRAVALIGAFGGLSMLRLPPSALPLWLDIASFAIIFSGMCGLLISFAWLRRSFSVLPQARALVMGGPYALVRHPVYLFEEIMFFGVMLQFSQPWAFAIFTAQLCFQLARIPFEERVLKEAFPEYYEYSARTARLIPGIY